MEKPEFYTKYQEEIIPAMMKEFEYTTVMQVPRLAKIVLNQGVGEAITDKRLLEAAENELSLIAGQKAMQTLSKRDISNFKLRRHMPIGVTVTLRRERMYEFLQRLIHIALPRIRDFHGIKSKLDGRGELHTGDHRADYFPGD